MTNPIIRIHDLETNEVIDREMTEAEFAAWSAQKAIDDAKAEEVAAAQADKAKAEAKLEALGITADDLKALGL
jgi:hypothetical protein